MTRSISHSTRSPAGDALSEYQEGAQSAREFLRGIFNRNAAGNACDTCAMHTRCIRQNIRINNADFMGDPGA